MHLLKFLVTDALRIIKRQTGVYLKLKFYDVTVYNDEQSMFQCITDTGAGCENQCYNDFAPISHIRYWAFHVSFCTCHKTNIW